MPKWLVIQEKLPIAIIEGRQSTRAKTVDETTEKLHQSSAMAEHRK
jgi:hypothetical protein